MVLQVLGKTKESFWTPFSFMAYLKHSWITDEIITAEKLNNLENGTDSSIKKIDSVFFPQFNFKEGQVLGTGAIPNSVKEFSIEELKTYGTTNLEFYISFHHTYGVITQISAETPYINFKFDPHLTVVDTSTEGYSQKLLPLKPEKTYRVFLYESRDEAGGGNLEEYLNSEHETKLVYELSYTNDEELAPFPFYSNEDKTTLLIISEEGSSLMFYLNKETYNSDQTFYRPHIIWGASIRIPLEDLGGESVMIDMNSGLVVGLDSAPLVLSEPHAFLFSPFKTPDLDFLIKNRDDYYGPVGYNGRSFFLSKDSGLLENNFPYKLWQNLIGNNHFVSSINTRKFPNGNVIAPTFGLPGTSILTDGKNAYLQTEGEYLNHLTLDYDHKDNGSLVYVLRDSYVDDEDLGIFSFKRDGTLLFWGWAEDSEGNKRLIAYNSLYDCPTRSSGTIQASVEESNLTNLLKEGETFRSGSFAIYYYERYNSMLSIMTYDTDAPESLYNNPVYLLQNLTDPWDPSFPRKAILIGKKSYISSRITPLISRTVGPNSRETIPDPDYIEEFERNKKIRNKDK